MNTRNIFWITFFTLSWIALSSPCASQREIQEVRYGSRWQIKMLKDKLNYDLVAPTEKEKRTYKTLLRNNQATVQFVENMLITNGLPKMLRNLVMIESGFQNSSISSANAIGIWQITPVHAEGYGLPEKNLVDIHQSTRVAVATLKDLYAKYGNWVKVIAAYNCGPTNLNKAIARAHSNQYHIFYKYLPDETINHVNKFMTACYITDELEELMDDYRGMQPKTEPEPPKTTTNSNDPTLVSTQIKSDINPRILAQEIGTSEDAFEKWNPNLTNDLSKYGKATLYLPIRYMGEFMSKRNKILQKSSFQKVQKK